MINSINFNQFSTKSADLPKSVERVRCHSHLLINPFNPSNSSTHPAHPASRLRFFE